MPSFKRKTSQVKTDRTPVGVYEGPTVPDGTYPAILRSMRLRTASTGTEFLNVLAVLDAKDKSGQNAKYDGFATWTKLWLTSSDFAVEREQSLYVAVAGKPDVDIQIDDKVIGDPIVTKIGGKAPGGTRVYVELKTEYDPEYGNQQNGFWIYPDHSANGQAAATTQEASDEPDEELDVEAEAKPAPRKRAAARKLAAVKDVIQAEAAEAEEDVDYGALTLPKIRAAAVSAGINIEGKSKKDLVADLEALRGGGEESTGKPNPQEVTGWDEDKLNEFLYEPAEGFPEGRYEEGDFDGMERKDTVELLVQDKHVLPF